MTISINWKEPTKEEAMKSIRPNEIVEKTLNPTKFEQFQKFFTIPLLSKMSSKVSQTNRMQNVQDGVPYAIRIYKNESNLYQKHQKEIKNKQAIHLPLWIIYKESERDFARKKISEYNFYVWLTDQLYNKVYKIFFRDNLWLAVKNIEIHTDRSGRRLFNVPHLNLIFCLKNKKNDKSGVSQTVNVTANAVTKAITKLVANIFNKKGEWGYELPKIAMNRYIQFFNKQRFSTFRNFRGNNIRELTNINLKQFPEYRDLLKRV